MTCHLRLLWWLFRRRGRRVRHANRRPLVLSPGPIHWRGRIAGLSTHVSLSSRGLLMGNILSGLNIVNLWLILDEGCGSTTSSAHQPGLCKSSAVVSSSIRATGSRSRTRKYSRKPLFMSLWRHCIIRPLLHLSKLGQEAAALDNFGLFAEAIACRLGSAADRSTAPTCTLELGAYTPKETRSLGLSLPFVRRRRSRRAIRWMLLAWGSAEVGERLDETRAAARRWL